MADQRREAYAAWQALLDHIRSLPGFADFLRPTPIADLARQVQDGPIVYVTVSPTRADALILTNEPDPVRTLALAGLTQETAYDHADRLRTAVLRATDPEVAPTARQAAQGDLHSILAWLWDTVTEPILAHLGHTSTPTDDAAWPRIWWCPVGVLAFLPLHAAGRHTLQSDPSAGPRTVSDLVVSSYTPTARALARSRGPRHAEIAPATLIVPVPDLPGAALPGVVAEATAITTLIPDAHTLHRPTRDSVLKALPSHRIAHFSCHGYADWADPAHSRLYLTDHATSPFTLADITTLHLDADLAYLSACDTAVTAPHLADESLHITAAFHLAGYRHVIGTLWPIDDFTAARIAEDFYTRLTTDGIPHPDRAARALHHAMRSLRARYPAVPTLWAAHTHTGA